MTESKEEKMSADTKEEPKITEYNPRNIVPLPKTEEDWKPWKTYWDFIKPWHHPSGYFGVPISGHTHLGAKATILYTDEPGDGPPVQLKAEPHTHPYDQYYVILPKNDPDATVTLLLGDKEEELKLPVAVYIPKYTYHAVLRVPGAGKYTFVSFHETPIYF